ncbi:amino acid ABC transporter ATP-binding protein [Clostridium sp.]|uniref:amino acid ABC transporter ATP-binding protein n=1 Tax=Clostridium sp. TaxID=1506 RepID=UPI001B6E2274|nr:amino acid ABC transporter ATP-binding protein [Clostridium sp.]MBP3915223.1 amino acid ABC transporter ATP-binding protein [Clostridium sp.]
MLKIRGLKKSFGKTTVLKGVDLDIMEGEIVVIVGPSGGGKTTLLRTITGLETCEEGTIEIAGEVLCKNGKYADKKSINAIRKNIGLVFQGFNLFPHKSVLENIIEAPIRVLGERKESAIQNANEILRFLGLSDKANNYPCELSGGQKQRVAIGRALALNPKLMCFDEPTSALDPSLTKDVAALIKSLSKKGMSMLIITHDMEFAKLVSNKIVSMDSGVIIDKHIYNDKTEISENAIQYN